MDCLVILHISFLNSEVWTFENSTRSITHLICLDFSLPGGELKQKISKIYFEPRHPGGDAPPCCRLQGPAGSPFPPGFFHFNFLQVFFTSWSIQCHLLLDKFSTELDVTSSVLPGGRPRLQGRFNHHPSRLQWLEVRPQMSKCQHTVKYPIMRPDVGGRTISMTTWIATQSQSKLSTMPPAAASSIKYLDWLSKYYKILSPELDCFKVLSIACL